MRAAHRTYRPRTARLSDELARVDGSFGLGQVPARLRPDAVVSSVCGYCSTGCSLDVHLRSGVPVNLTPTRRYPVNLGMACPKGWESLTPLAAHDRATQPLVRRRRRGRLEPVTWDQAIDTFVTRVRSVQEHHGPEAMAFLGTGQIPTEELAFLGSLAKFGMGMVHGDGNTRQCMASAVVAYKESFGFDAPPYTYADLEESDTIVLIGSNLAVAHPILWQRVCRNPNSPRIVVIDPRATETAMAATHHFAVTPKSDLTLLYGVAHVLIARDWLDRGFIDSHTSGFEEFADHVSRYSPEVAGEASGIGSSGVEEIARAIHEGERVSLWWTMGVNQSHEGVRTAQAIINIALMTGNMGRPGTGANSVTGQCNAMGSRLFSNTSSLLGGRSFADEADRRDVADALGIGVDRIPDHSGYAYDQIVEGIRRGHIRGLWVVATNSAHSWVNQGETREILDELDFLVVQDMYASTETARGADLVLPAAGWGEKDGTFINSERRIGRVRRAADPPGSALADFEIFRRIADAWGCGTMFAAWKSPEQVFSILAALTAGKPCDFSTITGYEALEQAGGIQWPFRGDRDSGAERRLFEDGHFFRPDGRARFVWEAPRPVTEPVSTAFPFVLLTGRGSSAQWHTQTRTSKSAQLRALYPERPYVEVSPGDAAELDIVTGELVVVESARGSMQAGVFVTPAVQPGQVFVPMHYEETNRLTYPSFDPYSRQPSYKSAAVSLRKADRWDRAR